MRKTEVPTYHVPKFELENTSTDIQWWREEREVRERYERGTTTETGGGKKGGGKSR